MSRRQRWAAAGVTKQHLRYRRYYQLWSRLCTQWCSWCVYKS
ncbi:UNVERIFIED_CONTAM: hypothetical protein GTU68_026424 [Idotea baltica]|nr:hypothetical protein [Idotea baltica]